MHTKSLCMKLECKINRLWVSLAIVATFVLLLILFAVNFSLEFSGLHRCGSAILGTDHTWFSLSWWKRSALSRNSFQLENGQVSKEIVCGPSSFLSHDHYFNVGTFEGFSPKEVKHFLSMSFSVKAKWKHGLRVNTLNRSIINLFLYFCHDLAIKALLCIWKCILSM